MNMFNLNGKIALVTGASYGIGFAIASGLAAAGAKIVFNDINRELVDKGIAAYKEANIDATGYVCDVTDEPGVQKMIAKIEREIGVVDILVNNAGIIRRTPMHEMDVKDFRLIIDICYNNNLCTFNIIQKPCRCMFDNGSPCNFMEQLIITKLHARS